MWSLLMVVDHFSACTYTAQSSITANYASHYSRHPIESHSVQPTGSFSCNKLWCVRYSFSLNTKWNDCECVLCAVLSVCDTKIHSPQTMQEREIVDNSNVVYHCRTHDTVLWWSTNIAPLAHEIVITYRDRHHFNIFVHLWFRFEHWPPATVAHLPSLHTQSQSSCAGAMIRL